MVGARFRVVAAAVVGLVVVLIPVILLVDPEATSPWTGPVHLSSAPEANDRVPEDAAHSQRVDDDPRPEVERVERQVESVEGTKVASSTRRWKLSDAEPGQVEAFYLAEADRRGVRLVDRIAVREMIDGLATGAMNREIELDLSFEDVDRLRPIAETYYPRILELLKRRRELVTELEQPDGSFVPTSEWHSIVSQLMELSEVVTQRMREQLPEKYRPCIVVY